MSVEVSQTELSHYGLKFIVEMHYRLSPEVEAGELALLL